MAVSEHTPGAIGAFLARVRGVLYRREATRATLYAIAALGGLAIVVPVLGHLLVGTRGSAVAVIGFAGLAAVTVIIGAAVLGFVVPRRKWSDDANLARWVGERQHDVASDLLSSVQLAAASGRPGAPSSTLVEALIASTEARLKEVEPARLVPALARPRRSMIATLAAHAVVLVAAPGLIASGWSRLVATPSSPYDGAQLSAIPLVGDLEAVLTFPAYAGRAPLRLPASSGDVRGLPGTTIDLRARVAVAAEVVELVLDPEEPGGAPRIVPVTLRGTEATAHLVIDRSTRYRFAVRAPTGVRSIESSPRSIEAEPDRAPAVQLMAPDDTLDVSNLRRVELAYVIEDDFGVKAAELVWEAGRDRGKQPINLEPGGGARALGKLLWDISEIPLPAGGEVRYWIEARDNDDVGGPNAGRSRELRLKVVSPRERHADTLRRHHDLAEKVIRNLGVRLVLPDAALPRDEAARTLGEAIVELGSISAAYERDPHASDGLRKALGHMRERLDRLASSELKVLRALKPPGRDTTGRFLAIDPKLIAELEDDVIVLADWLDRERVEGMLDVTDEIGAHHQRLADLLAQYQKTKDPRLLDQIERELKAIERAYAELDKHRRGLAEDVLDQYVHRNAIDAQAGASCTDEVRRLTRAGDVVAAQQKLATCRSSHDRSAAGLDGALAALRGDKFGDEQKKLDEVMNELADVANDQDEIATEANRIHDAYKTQADEVAKEHRREASKKVGVLVDKLRRRLREVEAGGLTPFAKEELDIVERRIADVEHMVGDGDLAEALGMARHAKTSLDTIAGELGSAIDDEPRSDWTAATQRALDGIKRATPVVRELITELRALSPRPDQILSADDRRAIERLRRREAMNRARTQRLAERTKQLGPDLPGDAGAELGKKLGSAIDQMTTAEQRMKAKDPPGTREAARAAAEALAKARDGARRAARQAQERTSISDEPIRIPGADEYRAPERFREDVLEAMKKKGGATPDGYDDMIRRYYQELVK